jgi:Protein of unknown function (DUF3644)
MVRVHLQKARLAAIAAVEVYNRPGSAFRTPHYLVLMTIAWTALFHAIFYKRTQRPWYRRRTGATFRYVRIDGEFKHWDLDECCGQFWGNENPPERENLRFVIGLRNRIEHRELPELDATLYGECQALLMNFENLLSIEFGKKYALAETLAVSLQFSLAAPAQRVKAIKALAASEAKSVIEYIERFRGNLPAPVLESNAYSFSVFLIPKTANRMSAADVAVEFVAYDANDPRQAEQLQKLTTIIKEKQVPVGLKGYKKPGEVVAILKSRVPFKITTDTHARAWRYYNVRPSTGDPHPEKTKAQYCVYDELGRMYGYTDAWVDLLAEALSNPEKFKAITGSDPTSISSASKSQQESADVLAIQAPELPNS